MKFVIHIAGKPRDLHFSVDWERQMIADFGTALAKAAMFLGERTIIMEISRAGVKLDTLDRNIDPTSLGETLN